MLFSLKYYIDKYKIIDEKNKLLFWLEYYQELVFHLCSLKKKYWDNIKVY